MIRRRTFSFKNASYATVQMFFYGGSNNSIKICLLFGRITAARLYFPSEITHVLDVDGGGYDCSTNFPHKSTLGKVRCLSEPTNQPTGVGGDLLWERPLHTDLKVFPSGYARTGGSNSGIWDAIKT